MLYTQDDTGGIIKTAFERGLMRAWARVGLSLFCVLVVATFFGLVAAPQQQLGASHPVLSWGGLALLFATPIWLLTIPFAVLLENADGWRGVTIFLVGNLLAPIAYVVVGRVEGNRFSAQADGIFFIYALIVSLPTTFLYVLLLSLLNRFVYKRNVNLSLLQ